LADDSKQAVDKIREVTEGVVENVTYLTKSSERLLQFMNDKVMGDYKEMTDIAQAYEKDAAFYSEISSELGASSQEMSASMSSINDSIAGIASLTGEIANYMDKMGDSAVQSNESSDAVLHQMEELFRLSEVLNQTVSSFRV
jgi:methyl-accepting chemotaxis protein